MNLLRLALLTLTLLGLACAGPTMVIPRHDLDQVPEPESWTRSFPADLGQVRLHAQEDCLFVTGRRGPSPQAPRAHLCLDPRSGEIRWVHEFTPASASRQEEQYFFTDQHLIYADRQVVLAVRRDDGQEAWRYTDPHHRPIYGAFVQGDHMALSLNNETLALLDTRSGQWRRHFALQGQALKQLAAAGEQGLYALLVQSGGAQGANGLAMGLRLDQGPQTRPEDPALALQPAWSHPITTWSYDVHRVQDIFLGMFEEGTWTALRASGGEVMWKNPEQSLPAQPLFEPSALYLHHSGQAAAQGQPERPTRLLQSPPQQPPGLGATWSLDVPSWRPLLGIETAPRLPRLLGATADTFFVVHTQTGRLLWSYSFNEGREPGRWTNTSSQGSALYLYFEPLKSGDAAKLKRIPILAETP